MTSATRPETTHLRPPGPKGHWLRGNIREFAKDRLGFLDENFRTYGDVVGFRLGPYRIVQVNHPELVEQVVVTQNRSFIKHFALKQTKSTLGKGLVTSEGDFWRRQRKLSQPAFHRDRIAGYADVMVRHTERMLGSWADGQTRDAQDDMMRLTLEIVAKTLFDAEIATEAADASAAMETLMRCFTARIGSPVRLPEWVPTPVNLRLRRSIGRLDRIVFRFIAERRASGEERDDLLSMLLHARDEDGSQMTDRQLRDELMTLFMAGHETTANTLAWVFWLLALNPDAESRLLAELDAVLDGRAPTFEDLPRLPFAEHVVNESLRLYPTVWLIGREAIEPCRIGNEWIARGTTVYMPQWVIHRDPRWYDDPLSYCPERWQDGLAKRLPRYAFFPFGGGPRACIGNNFAMMEAVLLLATIARRFRLRLAPNASVTPLPTMTLRPDHGVKVILEERRKGSSRV